MINGLKASDQASDLTGAFAEQPRGLGLGALTRQDGLENGEGIAITLTHNDPIRVHGDLQAWARDRIDRTFLLGPTSGHFYWGLTCDHLRLGRPGGLM